MVHRHPDAAPASALPVELSGSVVGRFCRACGGIYSLHAAAHRGKPVFGKDHVAPPCVHEGERFAEGADWWEPAVEVLAPPAGDASAGAETGS